MTSINQTFRSPAKINLYLKVTGTRLDGYHELETLFLPLTAPADEITIRSNSAGQGLSLSAEGAVLPLDSRNLCWKAAAAWSEATGIPADFHLHLRKIVPVAAGLGGGSANAATVLLALNGHYGAPLDDRALAALAVKLGADVPFFLHPRPAIARGIGEQLEYPDYDIARLPILIAAPDFPVRAAWAYCHLEPAGGSGAALADLQTALRRQDWPAVGQALRNDLAPAIFAKFPLLRMVRRDLLAGGACGAEISGSGPSLFAVCTSRAAAMTLAADVQRRHGGTVRTFVSGGENSSDDAFRNV